MAGYKLIKRLEVIIHLLQSYPYASKKTLIERLERDYDIVTTNRTMERDFKALETEFGIGLQYQPTKKGYILDRKDEKRIQSFFKFVELIHLGELFKESLEDFDLLREKVALEDSSKFKGIQYIKPLLLGIKQQRSIGFIHENYHNNTYKNYTICPLQIREYTNRWYVVGVPIGHKKIRIFGLDRISKLELKDVCNINLKDFEPQLDKFYSIVGLNYDAAERAEKVVLKLSRQQYKYLQSLPLHHSQQLEKETSSAVEVSYLLIPNFEFKMHLLKMGSAVEVLSPKWLRQEIKKELTKTLKQYDL